MRTRLVPAAALAAGLSIAGVDFILADAGLAGVMAFFASLLLTLPMPRGGGWLVALPVGLPVTILELTARGDVGAARIVLVAFAASYAAVALRNALAQSR